MPIAAGKVRLLKATVFTGREAIFDPTAIFDHLVSSSILDIWLVPQKLSLNSPFSATKFELAHGFFRTLKSDCIRIFSSDSFHIARQPIGRAWRTRLRHQLVVRL